MVEYKIVKSMIFEAIGCFALIFFGTFIDFNVKNPQASLDIRDNSLINFFILMSMCWMTSKHSGCQLNSSVSLAMLITGDLNWSNFFFNILGQFAGVALGQIMLSLLISNSFFFNIENFSFLTIISLEALFSFIYTLVYFLTFLDKKAERNIFAFSLASVYAFFILALSLIFYSRFNFVLILLPSILTLNFSLDVLWVTIGNLLGAVIAALIYKYIFKDNVGREVESMIINAENEIEY
jgi:glycerol uptake facilitator-like aquaporin